MNLNPLHATDGYKLGHRQMYQKGTTMIYSNFTPRSDRLFKGSKLFDNKMVVFGIQAFIKEFLIESFDRNFFGVPKGTAIRIYKRRVDAYLGAGVVPVDGFEALHDLGYLPIMIKALPEGSRVGMKVPVLTITNTHPDFFWLVNYLETTLSNSLWKMMVNATTAYEYRRVFERFAKMTGSPLEMIMWQGHDFSARGMSGPEDAARSGAAHLLSFAGTDTVSAIDYVEYYYNANVDEELVAGSVPATEHSVSSSNILAIAKHLEMAVGSDKSNIDYRGEAERLFIKQYITNVVPTGIASYVSDTYDYYKVISEILPKLKDDIMGRDGKLVIRPDSGDPIHVICGEDIPNLTKFGMFESVQSWFLDELVEGEEKLAGHGERGRNIVSGIFQYDDKFYKLTGEIEWNRHDKTYYYVDGHSVTSCEEIELTPQQKGSIQVLWETFGGTITETGHKLLDEHIGLIYGDSITIERQWNILERLAKKGFASANVVLGVGSYTYNFNTRDSFGSAVKATATIVNDQLIELYKDPATGDKTKKSAMGLLKVVRDEAGEYVLQDRVSVEDEAGGELQCVFANGRMLRETSLSEIRNTLNG
jgi:nicotinamide phosphoribosyltransferase